MHDQVRLFFQYLIKNRKHIGLILIGCTFLVFIIVFSKTVLNYYITLELIIVLSNFSYDFILILLCIFFRPQQLPPHFTVSFDVHEGENDFKPVNIYFAKIDKKQIMREDTFLLNKLSSSDSKKVNKEMVIPIVILNPLSSDNNESKFF